MAPPGVSIHSRVNRGRARLVTEALTIGLQKLGLTVSHEDPIGHSMVLYGMGPHNRSLYDSNIGKRPIVVIDLGYWNREHWASSDCCYKVAVNYWHPRDYLQQIPKSGARLAGMGIKPRAWNPRDGGAVLLAGMGPKSWVLYEQQPQLWDVAMAAEIRKHTASTIIYRPKPSWRDPVRIRGTTYSPPGQDFFQVMRQCRAVVTHHSNSAVDALVEGIPAFCTDGAASLIADLDLGHIEDPVEPPGRIQFLNNLAYANWSMREMREGTCWKFLQEEGLVS